MSSIVSWFTSLGTFDFLPGGWGISTGNVSNCVTRGEKAAWMPTFERSLSRGCCSGVEDVLMFQLICDAKKYIIHMSGRSFVLGDGGGGGSL